MLGPERCEVLRFCGSYRKTVSISRALAHEVLSKLESGDEAVALPRRSLATRCDVQTRLTVVPDPRAIRKRRQKEEKKAKAKDVKKKQDSTAFQLSIGA